MTRVQERANDTCHTKREGDTPRKYHNFRLILLLYTRSYKFPLAVVQERSILATKCYSCSLRLVQSGRQSARIFQRFANSFTTMTNTTYFGTLLACKCCGTLEDLKEAISNAINVAKFWATIIVYRYEK